MVPSLAIQAIFWLVELQSLNLATPKGKLIFWPKLYKSYLRVVSKLSKTYIKVALTIAALIYNRPKVAVVLGG